MTVPETQSLRLSRFNEELQAYIMRQANELRVLNAVISRRKKAYRDIRNRLDEVSALHKSTDNPALNKQVCQECLKDWPCDTYVIVRPSVIG